MYLENNESNDFNHILLNLGNEIANETENKDDLTPLCSLMYLESKFLPDFTLETLQSYQFENDRLISKGKSTYSFEGYYKSPTSFVMELDKPSFFKEKGTHYILVDINYPLKKWKEALVIYQHKKTGEYRLGLVSPTSRQFSTERFKHLFAYRPIYLEEQFNIKAIYPIISRITEHVS